MSTVYLPVEPVEGSTSNEHAIAINKQCWDLYRPASIQSPNDVTSQLFPISIRESDERSTLLSSLLSSLTSLTKRRLCLRHTSKRIKEDTYLSKTLSHPVLSSSLKLRLLLKGGPTPTHLQNNGTDTFRTEVPHAQRGHPYGGPWLCAGRRLAGDLHHARYHRQCHHWRRYRLH